MDVGSVEAYLIQKQYMGLLKWKHWKGNTRLLSSTKSWNLLKANHPWLIIPQVRKSRKIRTLSYHLSENSLDVNDILVHSSQETLKQGIEQDSCWASEYQHDVVRSIHWWNRAWSKMNDITKFHKISLAFGDGHSWWYGLRQDSTLRLEVWSWEIPCFIIACIRTNKSAYTVDLPAPLAPTMAILESNPTSK